MNRHALSLQKKKEVMALSNSAVPVMCVGHVSFELLFGVHFPTSPRQIATRAVSLLCKNLAAYLPSFIELFSLFILSDRAVFRFVD
jgi:uncharacterized membrane protein